MEALPNRLHQLYRRGRHRETALRSSARAFPNLCKFATRRVATFYDDTEIQRVAARGSGRASAVEARELVWSIPQYDQRHEQAYGGPANSTLVEEWGGKVAIPPSVDHANTPSAGRLGERRRKPMGLSVEEDTSELQ